jgi:hypothetical protein
MERAFRLLKIAHKREDIHRVHDAALSDDARARANAGEFLDVLLARRDQQPLRELLRVVVDQATDAERVERSSLPRRLVPRTHAAALEMLIDDRDEALAALAAQHALTTQAGAELRQAVSRASEHRPELKATIEHLFGTRPSSIPREAAHG